MFDSSKTAVALSILAATSACKPLALEAPPMPPSWSTACIPSDSAYVDSAFDKRHRPDPLERPEDLSFERERILSELRSLGYEVEIGTPPGYADLVDEDQFCAITLPGHVYVSKPCAERFADSDYEWTVILRHESVHARQQIDMGLSFYPLYAVPEGRLLSVEVPAYAETFDSIRSILGDDIPVEVLRQKAASVYKKYQGSSIPQKCFEEIAIEAWSER